MISAPALMTSCSTPALRKYDWPLLQLRPRAAAVGAYQFQLAVDDRHHDIVVGMAVPAGRGARRETPLGHPQMLVLELHGRNRPVVAHLVLAALSLTVWTNLAQSLSRSITNWRS